VREKFVAVVGDSVHESLCDSCHHRVRRLYGPDHCAAWRGNVPNLPIRSCRYYLSRLRPPRPE